MEIKILHFYPNLMSLYGSYANVAVLRRHLEALGHSVTVETVDYGQPAEFGGVDFVFMGAGTERGQTAALKDFARFGTALRAAADAGTAMLFAGTAMDLLGHTVTDAGGQTYDGVGLGEFTTVQGAKRIVGDVYGHTDLYPQAVVGFINKCSLISGVKTPLLSSMELGFGNENERGPEGFLYKNVIGSHLTGPVLVKNPRLLDWVLSAIYRQRGDALPEERPASPYEEQGYAVTAEQLRLRSQK